MNPRTSALPKGPLFKWFGSKWLASKHYPSPTQGPIYEPFAGGAGYSLRHASHPVHLAELDSNLQQLWQWLLTATSEHVLAIPLDLPVGFDIRELPLTYGQKLLLKNWQRTNNVSNCWTVSPWGNKPGQWTESTRSRVAADVHTIKHWKFTLTDGFALLESDLANDPTATWFIDPPYIYNYRYNDGKHFDYMRLRESVNRVRGQVIACEAVCPKTGAVPDYLPFGTFRDSITSRRKQGCNTHSKELIYCRDALL